jgi:hypothetical protein
MSKVGQKYRSFKKIELADLKRLADIAKKDSNNFFLEYPSWGKEFANRVLCVALCQGAGQHYVDGKTGINDFDIYTFYRKNPDKNWYSKRIKSYDFGNPKFGQSKDKPNFIGRRVDCLGREIDVRKNETLIIALRRYLKESNTTTSRYLSNKSVVLLNPKCGYVVWETKNAKPESS